MKHAIPLPDATYWGQRHAGLPLEARRILSKLNSLRCHDRLFHTQGTRGRRHALAVPSSPATECNARTLLG